MYFYVKKQYFSHGSKPSLNSSWISFTLNVLESPKFWIIFFVCLNLFE